MVALLSIICGVRTAANIILFFIRPTLEALANSATLSFEDALCNCSATTTITILTAEHVCIGTFHTGEFIDMQPKATITGIAAVFAGRATLVFQSALTHGRLRGRWWR